MFSHVCSYIVTVDQMNTITLNKITDFFGLNMVGKLGFGIMQIHLHIISLTYQPCRKCIVYNKAKNSAQQSHTTMHSKQRTRKQ